MNDMTKRTTLLARAAAPAPETDGGVEYRFWLADWLRGLIG